MTHDIPADVLNSSIEYCIDQYVRQIKHRDMLRDKWFGGMTLEGIAEKYEISVTAAKSVIYDIGDTILLRASKILQR